LELRILKSLCGILDLEKKGNREEIAGRIVTFLLEPKDSGKPVPPPRPKRSSAVKANSKGYSEYVLKWLHLNILQMSNGMCTEVFSYALSAVHYIL
jgi:hypothetical protein